MRPNGRQAPQAVACPLERRRAVRPCRARKGLPCSQVAVKALSRPLTAPRTAAHRRSPIGVDTPAGYVGICA